jgi:hypothetical protein
MAKIDNESNRDGARIPEPEHEAEAGTRLARLAEDDDRIVARDTIRANAFADMIAPRATLALCIGGGWRRSTSPTRSAGLN